MYADHALVNAQLTSEEDRAAHRQAFVRQYHQLYPNIPNPYESRNAIGHHLGEEVFLQNLHLKQGSVVQFPSKLHSTKFDYFHPPEEPMKVGR